MQQTDHKPTHTAIVGQQVQTGAAAKPSRWKRSALGVFALLGAGGVAVLALNRPEEPETASNAELVSRNDPCDPGVSYQSVLGRGHPAIESLEPEVLKNSVNSRRAGPFCYSLEHSKDFQQYILRERDCADVVVLKQLGVIEDAFADAGGLAREAARQKNFELRCAEFRPSETMHLREWTPPAP